MEWNENYVYPQKKISTGKFMCKWHWQSKDEKSFFNPQDEM